MSQRQPAPTLSGTGGWVAAYRFDQALGKTAMKTILAGIVASLLFTIPAIAQTPAGVPVNAFITTQGDNRYLAKDNLIGAKVYGDDGTIIGDIEDLIINDSNTVIGVIIGTGGVLGIGEKRVGVRLEALTFEDDGSTTRADFKGASEAVLKDVAAFERSRPKKSMWQRATEKAQELTDKTTATSKDAYEKAKPTLDAAKESVKETYQKAKEAAKPAVDAAKEAITPEPSPSE